MYGQNGDDVLIGGAGNDTLNGGPSADTFICTGSTNIIADFSFVNAFDIFIDSGESTNGFGFSRVNDDLEIQYDNGELIIKDVIWDELLF